MLLTELQHCPCCTGALNREHATVELREGFETRFLYCEHCEQGFEIDTYKDGTVHALHFICRTEPIAFGKFLQRLETAASA